MNSLPSPSHRIPRSLSTPLSLCGRHSVWPSLPPFPFQATIIQASFALLITCKFRYEHLVFCPLCRQIARERASGRSRQPFPFLFSSGPTVGPGRRGREGMDDINEKKGKWQRSEGGGSLAHLHENHKSHSLPWESGSLPPSVSLQRRMEEFMHS